MKVSKKQILFMYQVLMDSLPIIGSHSPFKFDQDVRRKYADNIFNQQDDSIVDFDLRETNEQALDEVQ